MYKDIKMKKIALLSIFVLLYGITSCSSDTDDMDPLVDNGVYYTGNIKTIIDNNCLSCHGSPVANSAPMMLVTRTQVRDAIKDRNLIGRVENGSMPNGNLPDLTTDEVQAIKDWKANNYAE